MQWLGFGKAKTPANIVSKFNDHSRKVQEHIDRELQQFKALGLPLPVEVSGFSFNDEAAPQTSERLQITYPTFRLPKNYRAYSLLDWGYQSSAFMRLDARLYYCLVNKSEEEFAEADELYKKYGVPAVLAHHSDGVWLNRDPYGLFAQCSGRKQTFDDDEVIGCYPERWRVPPIERLDSTILNEVTRQLMWRLEFVERCVRGLHEEVTYSSGQEYNFIKSWSRSNMTSLTDVPQWLFNNVLLTLPLPDPGYPSWSECETFKVLPSGALTTRQVIAFLDSIRPITQTVRFYIHQKDGLITFTITCHKDDRELISRQLSLHFPTFTTEDSFDPVHIWILRMEGQLQSLAGDVYSIYLSPYTSYEFFHPLSSFQVDPYRQLLAVLDQFPDEPCTIEMAFAPLDPQVIATMSGMLQSWHKAYPNEEAGRRGKQLARKSPAWMLQIRLTTTEQAHLGLLYDRFLKPIATHEQDFRATTELEGSLMWDVVSSEELASFVHFPTFDLADTRVETATKVGGQPPESYIMG